MNKKLNDFNNVLTQIDQKQQFQQFSQGIIKLKQQNFKFQKVNYQNNSISRSIINMSSTHTQQNQMKSKVQERIRIMMKNKKMQKLASEKDLYSEKPLSVYDGKTATNKHLDDLLENQKYSQNQTSINRMILKNTTKRMKSTIQDDAQNPMKEADKKFNGNKKFTMSNKGKAMLFQGNQNIKRVPSLQKIQSRPKLKRPSSVINKSTRSTTSRSRRQKYVSTNDQKAIEDKIRQEVQRVFQYGIKLQKYIQQNGLNLQKQKKQIFSQEITILRLLNSCRNCYDTNAQNEQQAQQNLTNSVEKQVIELIKKKYEKLNIISNCQKMTSKISLLIQERLDRLTLQSQI